VTPAGDGRWGFDARTELGKRREVLRVVVWHVAAAHGKSRFSPKKPVASREAERARVAAIASLLIEALERIDGRFANLNADYVATSVGAGLIALAEAWPVL